ncbi:MAG TPA: hypothetical protein VLX90_11900 [Steroidobacteraceae bacterium]|nr:hypothetical protein [Steroidobacteraceae bacterium]
MNSVGLPEEVRALLGADVETHEHLAILLLLHRDKTRARSVDELGSALGIAEPLAQSALQGLISARLVQSDCAANPVRYRYAATGTLDCAVATLSSEYAANPVQVIRFLAASAIERLRMSALRAFADAFVLKKDKDHG